MLALKSLCRVVSSRIDVIIVQKVWLTRQNYARKRGVDWGGEGACRYGLDSELGRWWVAAHNY